MDVKEQSKPRRRWPVFLAILIAGAVGYGGWRHFVADAAPAPSAAKAAPVAARVPVTFTQVSKADYPVRIYGLGTVAPFTGMPVVVHFDDIDVPEGDPVALVGWKPLEE